MTTRPRLATRPEAVPPVARACGAPDCGESLEGRPPNVRFCSTRCRKGAHRDRVRAERERAPANGARRNRPDPEQVAADSAAFVAALERETAASLRRDPERWQHVQSGDRDHHRAKPRRPDHDARKKP